MLVFNSKASNKTGVILLNIGTPSALTKPAVAKYLKEFLDDPRVIDLPAVVRKILVHGIIAPFRAKKSLHAYQSVWDPKLGSPLLYNSISLVEKLMLKLDNEKYIAKIAMTYGDPNVASVIADLQKKGVTKLIILPLFPQYATSSSGAAISKVYNELQKYWNAPELKVINQFYLRKKFIQAQAAIIANKLANFSPDYILFSYHGIPERHMDKSTASMPSACKQGSPCPIDFANQSPHRYCYRAQCYHTSKLIADELNWPIAKTFTSFQSRLGKIPWIRPYTDEILTKMISNNGKKLLVTCPSFTIDCLETLEEIGIGLKGSWHQLGGEDFELASCVNDHPLWIDCLAELIYEN